MKRKTVTQEVTQDVVEVTETELATLMGEVAYKQALEDAPQDEELRIAIVKMLAVFSAGVVGELFKEGGSEDGKN